MRRFAGLSVMRGSGTGADAAANVQRCASVASNRMLSVHANDSPMQTRLPPPNGK